MLALLYDIHGNLPALRAVVEDAERSDAQRFLVGGDVALFGAWPAKSVALARELPASTWIRGNGERWTDRAAEAPVGDPVQGAVAAAREALGDELVAELAALPASAAPGTGVRAWHGSPVSDVRSFLPDPGDDEPELLAGVTEARLVFGHTHLPFARTATIPGGAVELVNPGSVGMPFDGDPRAAYALMHEDGRVEHRRVDYDHRASAAAVRDRYHGARWAQIVARRLESARPVA